MLFRSAILPKAEFDGSLEELSGEILTQWDSFRSMDKDKLKELKGIADGRKLAVDALVKKFEDMASRRIPTEEDMAPIAKLRPDYVKAAANMNRAAQVNGIVDASPLFSTAEKLI